MFDWLRLWKPFETPEEAQATLRRRALRFRQAAKAAPQEPPVNPFLFIPVDTGSAPFQPHAGPSDGGAAHHSGACHTDAAASFGCDGGSFSHH
jgi:hypothetical protein